jgi:hypothetical protein
MLRKALYTYPNIKRTEIIDLVQNAPFTKLSSELAFQTKFFQQFKGRYNGVPVFSRYACQEVEKFKKSIPLFAIEPIEIYQCGKLRQTNKGIIQYDYKQHDINEVIFYLLKNECLKKITTLYGEYGFTSLDEHNDTLEKFSMNPFEEINPLKLDGEFADLALQGSVYCRWEYSASDTKAMAAEFVDIITERRFEDFRVYKSSMDWSGYVMGFFTAYFLFDEGKGEFWILSKDDYD